MLDRAVRFSIYVPSRVIVLRVKTHKLPRWVNVNCSHDTSMFKSRHFYRATKDERIISCSKQPRNNCIRGLHDRRIDHVAQRESLKHAINAHSDCFLWWYKISHLKTYLPIASLVRHPRCANKPPGPPLPAYEVLTLAEHSSVARQKAHVLAWHHSLLVTAGVVDCPRKYTRH